MDDTHVLNIGFDDTDSPKGMCTTFLAYKIVDLLKKHDTEFLDFPKLIRFNPNIPWKTRGNGAVSLKIRTKNPSKIKNQIKKLVERYSDIKNGANPGLVFYENKEIPDQFSKFSKLALWQLINRNHAKKFATKNNIEFFYQGNGQGLVGAIGAIGYDFKDHTLELLSYRKNSKFGKERKLSAKSVKTMQERTLPFTFNSFDNKK
ncbi:MAG: DNA-binding protein, partial [Nitrosopumilales archaeon CG15_BIG_FIL_POST_REV_8_21_14_020_33_23]